MTLSTAAASLGLIVGQGHGGDSSVEIARSPSLVAH